MCEIIAEGVIFIRNWAILTRAAFGIPHQKLFRVSGKDPAWCDNSTKVMQFFYGKKLLHFLKDPLFDLFHIKTKDGNIVQ